jgi:3'(2'), 5'-bisphosphate nucleotidase
LTTQISFLFETALTAILEASAEIMKIYGQNQFDIAYKPDESPVTIADVKSSEIISRHLIKTGIPIICEEIVPEDYEKRKSWEYFWLVDPLDGTKEFINRNGEFTVNIALIHRRTPVLGLITIPIKGLLYWGEAQKGAYRIKIPDVRHIDYLKLQQKATKLPVFEKRNSLKVAVSRSHLDDQTLHYIQELKNKHKKVEHISAGSSLKFCYIAEGKADIYLRFSPTMEWDTAAGQAIAEASGARMVKMPSKSAFYYNKKNLNNAGFIVSRNLHEFGLP